MVAVGKLRYTGSMTSSTLSQFSRLGGFALFALLTACGGGGAGGSAGAPSTATVPAPTAPTASPAAIIPLLAEAPSATPVLASPLAPAAAAEPDAAIPICTAGPCTGLVINENGAGSTAPDAPAAQGYLVAPTGITSGGDRQYPDLRLQSTLVMPFEAISVGDVSFFTVASES